MNAKLLAYQQIKVLPLPPQASKPGAIRRIFNNEQIIERFGKWLLVCGKAENTRINYTLDARQFGKFLLDKPLTSATKEDVRAFIAEMYAKGMKPQTMQRKPDSLRVLFDCLHLGSQVRVSVPRLVSRRKLPQHLPRVLSEKEIKQIIAAARTPRDRAILELGYASGLRVNELASLRLEDVDLRARSLIVRQGKGGNDRIALFGRPAAAALREYLDGREIGPLFVAEPRVQRGGLTRGKYGDWWGQWREGGKMHSVRLGDYELPTKERARQALDAFLLNNLPGLPRRVSSSDVGLSARSIFRIVVQAAKRAGLTGVHPHTLRQRTA